MVSPSFFEIYSQKFFDLLANKAKLCVLKMASSKCRSLGLTEIVVNFVDEIVTLPDTSGQMSANSDSS
jgi:kinesin family protein 2/24